MSSYWWECEECMSKHEFPEVTESKGITHYIWDVLIPSDWDQSLLVKKCPSCGKNKLRIAYIFPRSEETHLFVKHIVGLGPFDEYVPMMWETIPDRSADETWIDFKYINGRNIWGLNKPAVFTRNQIKEILSKYREKTGDKNFP